MPTNWLGGRLDEVDVEMVVVVGVVVVILELLLAVTDVTVTVAVEFSFKTHCPVGCADVGFHWQRCSNERHSFLDGLPALFRMSHAVTMVVADAGFVVSAVEIVAAVDAKPTAVVGVAVVLVVVFLLVLVLLALASVLATAAEVVMVVVADAGVDIGMHLPHNIGQSA